MADEKDIKKEIENYILNSSYFFKDRVDIAINRLVDLKQPFKMIGIIKRETARKEEINAYLKNSIKNRQKVKKWKLRLVIWFCLENTAEPKLKSMMLTI